jgi:hypothetical protein
MENVPIFRFNFSEEINKELGYFAKLHKHEDRTDFKENWQKWIEENEDLINKESERLKTLGYDGDIKDKMYKSTRYYFRKKPLRNEPIERGTRVVVSKELLEQMDEHIKNNHFNQNYTPQIAYEEFCNEYAELINNEINELNIDNNETSQNKIKKTYKNRFYVIVRQNKEEKQKNKKQTKKEVEVEEEKEDN